MATLLRLLLNIVILTILLGNISCLPRAMYSSYKVKRFADRQPREPGVVGMMDSMVTDNNNKPEVSRSIAETGRRNHVNKLRSRISNSSVEIGTPKILTRVNPARDSVRSSESDTIVFPGKTNRKRTIDSCPNGQIFCEDVENYPEDHLKEVLSSSGNDFRDLFGIDVIEPEISIGQRNDFTTETVMCESDEKVVFPKRALSMQDKWLVIVNQPNYEQGVRIEQCKTENGSCQFSDRFPLGYETSCKQKYISRKLLAVNEVGNTYADSFRIPSCCSCSIKMPTLANRFGYSNDADGKPAHPSSKVNVKPSKKLR